MTEIEELTALLREIDPVRDRDFAQQAPGAVVDSILAQRTGAPVRRGISAAALLVVAVVAALGGAYAFTSHHSPSGPKAEERTGGPSAPEGFGPSSTPVSLSDAAAVLGQAVVLPSASLVAQSDVRAVTEDCPASGPKTTCVVHVSFPSQAVTVSYSANTYPDPLATYKGVVAQSSSDGASVVYLSGVPALVIPQNPNDPSGSATWIEFEAGGLSMSVVGHYAPTALEGVAQSIVAQLAPATSTTATNPG